MGIFFVSVYEGRIYKINSKNEVSVFYEEKELFPAGLAIDREGNFLIANVGDLMKGTVTFVSKDGKNQRPGFQGFRLRA